MTRIERVASSYRQRGMLVQVLSAHRVTVTDPRTKNVYHVASTGRVIVGKELQDELQAKMDSVPEWLRQGTVMTSVRN